MKKIIDVMTGEVKIGDSSNILVSSAIGSCVVVIAIDVVQKIGALAHIMLPGKAPLKEKQQKTKYAVDAMDKMLELLEQKEVAVSNLQFVLVGGGNVLKRTNDTIGNNNIKSILDIFNEKQLKISARSLGGVQRRSARLEIENAEVYYSEGDSDIKLLWPRVKY